MERVSIPTTAKELQDLVGRSAAGDGLLVGQELGTLAFFVHDVRTALGVEIRSFNADQLRRIAASRKKTDRRAAFWIAKALQTGMTPHPVYIPTGPIRRLRSLLAQRDAVVAERKRWLLRARSCLRSGGCGLPKASRSVARLRDKALGDPDGLDAHLAEALDLCQRREAALSEEARRLDALLEEETADIPAIQRLRTIPAVGDQVAVRIYAAVGDISRFPNARALAAHAGLVPNVHQSGEVLHMGRITRMGSPALRGVRIQAGHVLLSRCDPVKAGPLREIASRIQSTRGRRKIAVVGAARHILRIAYDVLRDGSTYDPHLLRSPAGAKPATAA